MIKDVNSIEIDCPLKCGKTFTKTLMYEHLKNLCPKRMIVDNSIFFCRLDFSIMLKSNWSDHVKKCEECDKESKLQIELKQKLLFSYENEDNNNEVSHFS